MDPATEHKIIEILNTSIIMPVDNIVLALVKSYRATNEVLEVTVNNDLKDALKIQASTYKSILIMVVGNSDAKKMLDA